MNLKEYYSDMGREKAKLEQKHPDGVVYVTSLYSRDRNSTPGCTLSASCYNAARVITDGTHRESTREEVDGFLNHQQSQRVMVAKAEQLKKQQYMIVVDQTEKVVDLAGAKVSKGS